MDDFMPATNANFARTTFLMLAVGALLLIGIILSSLWLVTRTQAVFTSIVAERNIRRTSADLMQNMVDAETGQRGFLLSQDESFLNPYRQAVDEINRNRTELERLLQNSPERAAKIPELDRLIGLKTQELATTIDLARNGQPQEAITRLKDQAGMRYMNGIREILDYFKNQSDTNLRRGVDEQVRASAQLRWFTIGGAVAIVIVLGGAVMIIFQHVRDLSQARREVELLNEGLEARVNERTEDLLQANQEVQRYAYIVTHDLRAPLVNVMGFTAELETALKSLQTLVLAEDPANLSADEIEQAKLAAAEDLPEAITFIRSSTKKMDRLINAILKISRDGRRQLKPELIDLKDLLETTSASVHHQVSDGDGRIELDVRVPRMTTDRFSLEQILGNLFDNAVKYKDKERPLLIKARVLPDQRNFVRLEVEDNGRGVAGEDHERIFELFRRSGQQDQVGEGIGLAHVRSLARNLGGEITLKSELGKGATFILRLPSDLSRIVRS